MTRRSNIGKSKKKNLEDVQMDMETYDRLVETIYDAPFNEAGWQTTITNLKQAFASSAAGFFVQTRDNRLGNHLLEGIDTDQINHYRDHYAAINPWFAIPNLMRPGNVITDFSLEHHHKNDRAFTASEFYQDWCKPQDLRHAIGGSLTSIEGNLLNFTLLRPSRRGYYSKQEIELYSKLNRHLAKAVDIETQTKPASMSLASEAAFDKLRLGIVFMNEEGRILDMNAYATKLIKRENHLFKTTTTLELHQRGLAKVLKQAILRATEKRQCSSFILPRHKQSALSVCIIPSNERRRLFEPHVITLFVSDPDDREITDTIALGKRWNLTPLEAEFALLLAKGKTIKKIAEKMQLTENTARWYSKQIMNKIGVKRQAELSAILMKDIAMWVDMLESPRS
jgi:DNA-binding CsgD family transcriptional regulator